jgi:hypothetical protein
LLVVIRIGLLVVIRIVLFVVFRIRWFTHGMSAGQRSTKRQRIGEDACSA